MLESMSYSITVKSENGTLTAESSGDVPDGKYMISGHVDNRRSTLGVWRYGADGIVIEGVSSDSPKAGE